MILVVRCQKQWHQAAATIRQACMARLAARLSRGSSAAEEGKCLYPVHGVPTQSKNKKRDAGNYRRAGLNAIVHGVS